MSDNHDINYKKIYFILVGLLLISVAGPFLGILWVTLLTAFGIALVKANLVIQNFMHLRWEKRLMKWVLASSLIVMLLLVAGVSPDVMNHEGNNWENLAAKAAVDRGTGGGHGVEEVRAEEEPAADVVEAAAAGGFDARATFNTACAACHGQAGDGAGPAGAVLQPRPADFTDPAFWATRDDERIFTSISQGAVAVGGSPLMVGWSNSYDEDEIRALVEYVKTFRPSGQ